MGQIAGICNRETAEIEVDAGRHGHDERDAAASAAEPAATARPTRCARTAIGGGSGNGRAAAEYECEWEREWAPNGSGPTWSVRPVGGSRSAESAAATPTAAAATNDGAAAKRQSAGDVDAEYEYESASSAQSADGMMFWYLMSHQIVTISCHSNAVYFLFFIKLEP